MKEEQAGPSPTLGKVQGLRCKSQVYLWSMISRVFSLDLLRHLVVTWFCFFYSFSAFGHHWDVVSGQEDLNGLGSGRRRLLGKWSSSPAHGSKQADYMMTSSWTVWRIDYRVSPSPTVTILCLEGGHGDLSDSSSVLIPMSFCCLYQKSSPRLSFLTNQHF